MNNNENIENINNENNNNENNNNENNNNENNNNQNNNNQNKKKNKILNMNNILKDKYLLDFLSKNKKDNKMFITFLFFDIKTIKHINIKKNIEQSIDNIITEKSNIYMNILSGKKESHKKKIKETLKKYENNIKLIDKQLYKIKGLLDNIQLSKKLKNNKFENKQNFKIDKNIFYINEKNNLKYIFGELFVRFLFSKLMKSNNSSILNQNQFYSKLTNKTNAKNNILKEYFYSYFYLIKYISDENPDFGQIFDIEKLKENLKKITSYVKIKTDQQKKIDKGKGQGQGKGKGQGQSQGKGQGQGKSQNQGKGQGKGQGQGQGKRGGKIDLLYQNQNFFKGGNDTNLKEKLANWSSQNKSVGKTIIVTNTNKSKTSSSINKTNNSFKIKNELLRIMKNTFIQEKINNENNLFKLFNKEFLNIIEPYIVDKLNTINTLDELKKKKLSNPFCTEDVNAEFLLENILKNKKQVLDKLHKKKDNNFKSIITNSLDYEDNFNLIQMLRSSICNSYSIDKLEHFTKKLFKEFLYFFKTLLELKKMIYQSILNELSININKNKENNIQNKNEVNNNFINNNQTLTGIDLINNLIKKHNKSKSNIIFIKKIKLLIEKKRNLHFGDKNYDKKKQMIEKIINDLLLNLK